MAAAPDTGEPLVSEELQAWLDGDSPKTLGGLSEVFEEKSFALLFVLLLGVSALPIPTGGATHVFDVIAVIVAAQLVIGRESVWVPDRWRGLQLAGGKRQKFIDGLLKGIRLLERVARPRLTFLLDHKLSRSLFGLVVIGFTAAAFFAPPFSGLDTLPALGVVLVSLGVLTEDAAVVAGGIAIGVGGIVLEITVGKAALDAVKGLL